MPKNKIDEILRNRVKFIDDGEWTLLGTPNDVIEELEQAIDLYTQSRVREARRQELEEVSIQSLGIRTATDADELRDYIDKRISQLNQPREDNQ